MSTSRRSQVASVAAVPSPRRLVFLRRLLFLAGFVVTAWLVGGAGQASAAEPSTAHVRQQAAGFDPARAFTAAVVSADRVADLESVAVGAIGSGADRIPVERGIDIAPTLLSSLPVAQAGYDSIVTRSVTELLLPTSSALDNGVGQRALRQGLGSVSDRSAQGPSAKPASASFFTVDRSLFTPDNARCATSARGDSIAALSALSGRLSQPVSVPDRTNPLPSGTSVPANHTGSSILVGQGSADGQPALVGGHGEPVVISVGYVNASTSNSLVRHRAIQPGTSPD